MIKWNRTLYKRIGTFPPLFFPELNKSLLVFFPNGSRIPTRVSPFISKRILCGSGSPTCPNLSYMLYQNTASVGQSSPLKAMDLIVRWWHNTIPFPPGIYPRLKKRQVFHRSSISFNWDKRKAALFFTNSSSTEYPLL